MARMVFINLPSSALGWARNPQVNDDPAAIPPQVRS